MSNYLAIATVTAALRHMLENTVRADVQEAKITTLRPDNTVGSTSDAKVNIYLYQVTPNAARRLKAIEEFTELGAGFKIALRDLEIRGAGNILGTQQSGHIAAVGYEMYCQLLENAVRTLKKQPPEICGMLRGSGFPTAYTALKLSRLQRQNRSMLRRLKRNGTFLISVRHPSSSCRASRKTACRMGCGFLSSSATRFRLSISGSKSIPGLQPISFRLLGARGLLAGCSREALSTARLSR